MYMWKNEQDGGESVGYRCYRMVYHLENGETIKDVKEFWHVFSSFAKDFW